MPASDARSRLWPGLAALVLVAAAAGWFLLRRSPSEQTPAGPGPAAPGAGPAGAGVEYVNDRLWREIDQLGLTVDRARQLFVLEVTSLPGVTPPAGPVSETFCGTHPLTLLQAVRDQLTREQRARLDELTDPGRSVLPANLPPAPPPFVRPPYSPPAVKRASYSAASDEDLYRAYFMPMYEWANKAINALTGAPPVPAFLLTFEPLDGHDWAMSGAWRDGKQLTTTIDHFIVPACQSRIDVEKFKNQAAETQLSVVTHEVFHCYQQLSISSADMVSHAARWVTEGQPTWMQMTIVPPAVFPALQRKWSDYLMQPKTHLFDRVYDAAGFFGHVGDMIGQAAAAQRMIAVYRAAASGTSGAAFDTMVGGSEDRVFDTWASSYFRTHEAHEAWTVKGPGPGNFPAGKMTPERQVIGPGDSANIGITPAWELSLVTLESSADVLTVATTDGHASLIDRSEQVRKTLMPNQPIALCLRGDCSCPAGTDGEVPPTIAATSPIDIGFTGGRLGAQGWAHAESLSEFCKPKKEYPNTPQRPVAPAEGGGSNGEPSQGKAASDPHLVTYDGRYYDLQAVGEFVLTRSTADDFAVQVRFGRIGGLRTVSVTSSMATRIGADRVTVSIDPPPAAPVPVARVNGTKIDSDFVRLSAGSIRATFHEAGTGYSLEFDDGTRVGVSPFARQGLTVWVVPAPGRKGKLTGLLGDFDGDAANDPVTRRTTTVLPSPAPYDDLYGTFATSWRITAAESLFDYGLGETTATFSDPSFPDRDKPPAEPAAVAVAQRACQDAGITHPDLLRNCAVDLAATGNRRVVRAYKPQQYRLDLDDARSGPRNAGVVTPTRAPMRTKSIVLEGRVTDGNADAFASFEGFRDDVVYLDPENCQKPRSMRLLGPDGRMIGGFAPACGFRTVLPADGTYQLALNPLHDFTGPYRVSIVAVRPDTVAPLKPGEPMRGTIAHRAEQHVFLVEVKAPGALTIGGDGCSAEFDAAIYFGGGDELISAGPACRIGTLSLPKAGTYRIVLNPFSTVTGPYTIPTR